MSELMIEKNADGLPVLTKEVMNAIFDCVYGMPNEYQNNDQQNYNLQPETINFLNDEYFKSFMMLLQNMADFNLLFRPDRYEPLYSLIHPIVNFEFSLNATPIWLSKVSALKDIYNLKDKELSKVMKLITIIK